MSVAGDRLARSRLAIIEQVHRRERGNGDRPRAREDDGTAARDAEAPHRGYRQRGSGGWFDGIKHALGTWWRHHPAHMGVELATPMVSSFARRKPMQFLGIAAAVGAAVVIARPWRLVSATGLVVALLKSSQLSALVMSALSAADFQKDARPYD